MPGAFRRCQARSFKKSRSSATQPVSCGVSSGLGRKSRFECCDEYEGLRWKNLRPSCSWQHSKRPFACFRFQHCCLRARSSHAPRRKKMIRSPFLEGGNDFFKLNRYAYSVLACPPLDSVTTYSVPLRIHLNSKKLTHRVAPGPHHKLLPSHLPCAKHLPCKRQHTPCKRQHTPCPQTTGVCHGVCCRAPTTVPATKRSTCHQKAHTSH